MAGLVTSIGVVFFELICSFLHALAHGLLSPVLLLIRPVCREFVGSSSAEHFAAWHFLRRV